MDSHDVKAALLAGIGGCLLFWVTACSGADDAGASGGARADSSNGPLPGGAQRTPEEDRALVLHPIEEGALARAVAAAREESTTKSPVITEPALVPAIGGVTAFFQLSGDYRQCGRMEPEVDYGLGWRFAPATEVRRSGSRLSLDAGAIPAGASGNEAGALAAPLSPLLLEVRVGAELVGQVEIPPGWSSIDLPVAPEVPLAEIRLRVAAGHAGNLLLGNARLREPGGDVPPTVLFVTFDTSRADHFSAIDPASPARTPHFDRIASEGVLYTNCYSPTNVTNPSHVSLMTGVSPRDTKIVNNHTPLHHSAVTLAEHFEAAGYQTYAVLSAFHLGHELSGLGQGFQRLDTTPDFARPGEETLAIAEEWVGDAEGSPLFLWLHLFDPHAPYRLPESRLRKLLDGRPDPYEGESRLAGPLRVAPIWATTDGFKDPAFLTALYGGGVEHLDDLFGRILANHRFDLATVVATADHGEALGERDVWWDHSGTFYPTLHVPLAIRDARVVPGTVITEPVENLGAARLLLDLLGLPAGPLRGTGLPITVDPSGVDTPRFALSAHGGSASIAEGDWLLEMFLRGRDVDSSGRIHVIGSCYLYSTRDDPKCSTNLVAVEYERAKAMRSRLIDWVQSAEITGMNPVNHDVDPRVLEKLASMGYSEGPEQMASWWVPGYQPKEGEPYPWSFSPWNLGFTEPNGRELLEAAVAADRLK